MGSDSSVSSNQQFAQDQETGFSLKLMEGEKQGRLGNLQDMTLPQLLELLQRQEKLLSKQKFLGSLPDGGQKVKHFVETLRQAVSQRQQKSDGHTSLPPHDFTLSEITLPQRQYIEQIPQANVTVKHNSHSNEDNRITVRDDQLSKERHVDAQEEGTLRQGAGEETDTTASLCERLDSLAVSESAAPDVLNRDNAAASAGENLEILYQNSYENVMKRKAASSPRRLPFKPHSSLKVSDIEQLPEEYKYKSKLGNGAASISPEKDKPEGLSRTPVSQRLAAHVEEESAVHGPAYKFKGAREISVQDSIVLQRQQREELEKIQTLHAAERLAERFKIKTVDYNPHSLDMNYRSSGVTDDAEASDSDDMPDADDDLLD